MKEHTFIDVGPADQVITEENMRRSFDMNVKIEFIEQANRKIVIPLKVPSLVSRFEFSKWKGHKSA
jgi:ABC-type cobalamin/Fe3+-siderophores transport system ATPase subunit